MKMKKMIKSLVVAITLMASLGLSGCSSINPLSVLTEKPSVELNANVGKNVKQDKSVISAESGKTEQTADEISNDTAYTADKITQITEQMPPWMFGVVILLAGLAIDGKGFVVTVRSDVISLLKFPFNFILAILGREKL